VGSIGIVGLGGRPDATPDPGVADRLRSASVVVLPRDDGDAAAILERLGVDATGFDEIGLAPGAPSASLAERLAELAAADDVVVASSGYPLVRSGLLTALLERSDAPITVSPVASPLGVLMLAFDVDITADVAIVDVDALPGTRPSRDSHLVVTGVRNPVLARKAVEHLLRDYTEDHAVVVASCLEAGSFALGLATLASLVEIEGLCGDTALFVPPTRLEAPGDFDDLVRIIAVLRGPDGCPWDREQTSSSLRRHVIEEAYEVVSAIEAGETSALGEELGDLLLQIVLQAQIASEEGHFDIGDVTAGITSKLRRRHPHIFGGIEVADADEVSRNWDAIKRGEKPGRSVLDGVPPSLPSLAKAQKISKRAAGIGFDWETVEDVWEKVHEEIEELKGASDGGERVAEEVGDVLFTVVNVARKLGVDSEIALRDACDKFARRFSAMERAASGRGEDITAMSTDEMERLWQDAKQEERASTERRAEQVAGDEGDTTT
jgi:tetrapyrrole methylase family protein/MazG family protein